MPTCCVQRQAGQLFAVQRLASLLLAARVELHVLWASHPLSLVDGPPRWRNAP